MNRPELATELERLASDDLAVRQRLADTGELFDGYHQEMRAIHRRNGERLVEVLDEVGCWPGFRLVGEGGSAAAFLIAQHDIANPALMRRCRDLYAAAVDDGDADPANLAKFEDRIRYFEGRDQRYGTQWGWDERGVFGPWPPIDEPDRVDERRIALGLPPLSEAINEALETRPAHRSASKVKAEQQQAAEFAREVGWRID